ncbi:MAG: D-aminoacyl-tRNA deacylase [Acidaminococcaceae bacterium]
MRAVIQRVSHAEVKVAADIIGRISEGLLILLGVEKQDSDEDLRYLYEKITNLRIFEDEQGKMNLSVRDVQGQLLIVSQFTLYADCRKGRRPSFENAASPEKARMYYESFIKLAKSDGFNTETGQFQAHMSVNLCNDGPVTIVLDSKKIF